MPRYKQRPYLFVLGFGGVGGGGGGGGDGGGVAIRIKRGLAYDLGRKL